jgi:hypothetical protein
MEFDERTGVRSRSFRHEFVKEVVAQVGVLLRQDSLLHFVQDVHQQLGLALCAIGPNFNFHDCPEFGFSRPLFLQLGAEPAGFRDNVICSDPAQLQPRCSKALTAEKFDSWCVGVALSCFYDLLPFANLTQTKPLNCLRTLRHVVFREPIILRQKNKNMDHIPFDTLNSLLCFDPDQRSSFCDLPRPRHTNMCTGKAKGLVQEVISETLKVLFNETINGSDAPSSDPLDQHAFSLLSTKLDLTQSVVATDKRAAFIVCAVADQAALLEKERRLVAFLFDVALPQLAVKLRENEPPRQVSLVFQL